MSDKDVKPPLTPEQARNRRNIATALAITGFILLVFFVTMAKIKGNVLERPF
ncbi:MAG: hypothetical protein ABWZ40_12325 [Caulobacterales bacterium]